MFVIRYTPCALNSTGTGAQTFFNEDGAIGVVELTAIFDAIAGGGKVDGNDVYIAELISGESLAVIREGNGYVNKYILPNEALRTAYAHCSFIDGAVVADGKVVTPGGAQTVLQTTVTLTPAIIKAFFSSPYVLVPAPGVGFVLVPLQMTFITRNAGKVAYTNGAGGGAQGPQLSYNGDFGASPFSAIGRGQFTANGLNEMNVITSPNAWGANVLSAFENQPLTLAGSGTEDFAVGTGTAEVSLSYLKIAI